MKFYKNIIFTFLFSYSLAQESIFDKTNIAKAYLDAGLYEDALVVYSDILSIQIEVLGKYNLELINTLYSLSDVSLLNDDIEKSKKYLKEALDIQQYNFLLSQKKYLPTLLRFKNLYSTTNDSDIIKNIDSLSYKISNLDNDSLFFQNDTLNHFPNIISLYEEAIDSSNFVSEYSNNDRALDLINESLQFLKMGVFSESAKKLDQALKTNASMLDIEYLLNIDYGNDESKNNLYQAFYEIEEFDSTITSAQLFLGLLGFSTGKKTDDVSKHLNTHIKLFPDDNKGYILLGDVYFKNNDYLNAINYYMRSLLLNNKIVYPHFNMAKALFNLGYYKDAIDKFVDVIELDKNNFEAQQYLGISYYFIQNYEKSISELTTALLIAGNNYNTYYYLGKSYNQLNKKKQALESFIKSIEYNANHGEAHLELGLIYESILKLDQAIYHYKIARKFINSDILNYNLGVLLYNNENYSDALTPLRNYIIFNPENLQILEFLGEIFIYEKRYSEAIDTYDRLIVLNPYNESYYIQIAKSFLELGNYKEAQNFYKKVLEFNEENPEILFSIGQISNILYEYSNAEEYFLESIHCGYKTKELLFQLGLAYGGQKKYLQALEVFREALIYAPNDPIMHYQLGIVLKELEIYDLAIKELVEYLNYYNNDAVVYRMIGECYYFMNNFEDSIQFLLQASDFFQNEDSQSYYYLGLASFKNKEEWNAAKYFKQVLKINPDHALSRYQLIDVYLTLNKKREANKECDILYMLDRKLFYSAQFCNQ